MKRAGGGRDEASTDSEAGARRAAPGKVTRVERSGGAPSRTAGAPAVERSDGGGERAGDWKIDELLLTAMGFGDLESGEGDEGDAEREAVAAAAEDRAARARDPVAVYLNIHSNAVAHQVAAMLRAHQDEWPAPAAQLGWGDTARFTQRMVQSLCPVVRDDSFSLFSLVHPLRPDDAYRKYVAGTKAKRTTWIAGFGEAVTAQLKAAMFHSIERLGVRFERAAAAGSGEPPSPSQIAASHPLDSYVRGAMGGEGVLDYSSVWRPASGAPAGKPGKAGTAAVPSISVQWMGRQDASLWNYVRVTPPDATVEQVAAALYGSPAQSRMAFALQKHGELFQVAPKQARELIATRYRGEVTGRGTARDGAALVRSPLGDAAALQQIDPSDAAEAEPAAQLPQLLDLHFAILARLEELRAAVAPLGLAGELEPAFAFRARTMEQLVELDDAQRGQWQRVWHAQHVHLVMIAAAVTPLAAQATAAPAPSPSRAAFLRERLSRYLAAAAVSHLKESCGALLAELTASRRQDLIDEATDAQIGLRDARREARSTPGHTGERGDAEADAALTSATASALRGGSVEEMQVAQLGAEEIALRTRIQTVRLALVDLGLAVDEAGAGLSAEIARCCSGKFRALPALIDELQLRLFDVERAWAAATGKGPEVPVVADERAAARAQLQARGEGLDVALRAFATIAGDQDIGTFLRQAQGVVSSQRFRSGIVKLAGSLAIMVVTSGIAAGLGAGLAGLVGAGEVGSAAAATAVAARAGAFAINVAVNVTVNSALQYAMSEGHESMGWALVENALMELATRGLGKLLRAPMAQLHALEQQALREGGRLRELAALERSAARRGEELAEALVEERQALRQTRAERSGWFVAQLSVEVILGMASQWAARSLLQAARGPGAEVSDDFASNVLQQGAAIALGKRLFGLKAAWDARRAELESKPWFATLPEARSLVERRSAFFGEADRLAHSVSPEPGSGSKLLAQHEELVRLEQAMVVRGEASRGAPATISRGATADSSVPSFHHKNGEEAASALVDSASQRATGQMSAIDPRVAELARIRNGVPGTIRSERELSNADVADSMNTQLRSISSDDVRDVLSRFPEAEREQARYVLARSSQYGSMDSWNALRRAMEPELGRGNALYLPGSGSLADNLAYVSSKGTFQKVQGVDSPLTTTTELRNRTFMVLDDVVMQRIETDPAFVLAIRDYSVRLLEPRGFRNGINLYNSPTADSVFARTDQILRRAQAIGAEGGKSFEQAVDAALSNGTADALRTADPAIEYHLKEIDVSRHPHLGDEAISRQLNGEAGITEAELTAQLSVLSPKQQEFARELMAQQAEIFSPRRLASELADQHSQLMGRVVARGISPENVYFYIPEKGKSYGMLAMAHRQATGVAVERYINGPAELKERRLGKATALVVFDDVAGSGMSLRDSVELMLPSYQGTVLVSPMVSTEKAKHSIESTFARTGRVDYAPRGMSRALDESFFYKNLSEKQQETMDDVVDQKGFGKNALSMSFPYMAPDNNNSMFGDLIAKFFMLNQNRSAAKSPPHKANIKKGSGE